LYYLADRGGKDDQFFYEKRIRLRHVGIELTGGYVFDRLQFEGEGYSERNEIASMCTTARSSPGRLSFTFGGCGALHFMSSNVARVPSSAAGFRLTRGTPDVILTIGVTIALGFFFVEGKPAHDVHE
jgi:hypothetical protein